MVIGATIIQNALKSRLPPTFIEQFTSPSDLTYVAIPVIGQLGEPLKSQVQAAYSSSLRLLWLIQLGLCAIGLLSALLQREIPLHSNKDKKWGMKEEPTEVNGEQEEKHADGNSRIENDIEVGRSNQIETNENNEE